MGEKNMKGFMTLDFLFALILVFTLSGLLFAFTFTLSVVEITQYVAFATARNYFAAHKSVDMQKQMAQQKFKALTKHPVFGAFYSPTGWFSVDPTKLQIGDDFNAKYLATDDDTKTWIPFSGVIIPMQIKLLSFNTPFFGKSSREEQGREVQISTFLGREPTAQECMDFYKKENRFSEIKSKFGNSNQIKNEAYKDILDNGC